MLPHLIIPLDNKCACQFPAVARANCVEVAFLPMATGPAGWAAMGGLAHHDESQGANVGRKETEFSPSAHRAPALLEAWDAEAWVARVEIAMKCVYDTMFADIQVLSPQCLHLRGRSLFARMLFFFFLFT